VWADGVYLQARMEAAAECMLVLIGATPEGDVAPRFRTGRFFSYAALAVVMSILACAGVRYPTLEWRRCRL